MEFQHELIIPDEGLPFKLFLFEGEQGNYVREKHWHTSIEIFSVLEGSLSFFLNNEEHMLCAGDFIIINSNEIHSIHAPRKNKTVVLQIPLNLFEEYFTAQHFIRFKSGRQKNADNNKMAALIRKIYEVLEQRDLGYDFQMRSIFYEILYEMVTKYREVKVMETEIIFSHKLDKLSKITTYMREHYKEDLKLSELADMFGYSDAYLSRMFRKYAKINFKSYLQDIRMVYAYRELLHTDHTISQIALNNGFCSSRGFSKDFQKRYGFLPSEMARIKKEKVKKVL